MLDRLGPIPARRYESDDKMENNELFATYDISHLDEEGSRRVNNRVLRRGEVCYLVFTVVLDLPGVSLNIWDLS